MEIAKNLLGGCQSIIKGKQTNEEEEDEDASEIQLNAFEFRNYRTVLDDPQQQLLERIVNHWCVLLVKGKSMNVQNDECKVYLDKDLLNLVYENQDYALKQIKAMHFFTDDMMQAEYVLEIVFEGDAQEEKLLFNFTEERQRINFALTLRILRSRDPELDPSQAMEVKREDDSRVERLKKDPFREVVKIQHFNCSSSGLSVVFSVSDMKLYQKLQTTSRHVYLEFFVRYPHQDRYMYAKSPTEHIPSVAVQTEELGLRRRGKKMDEEEEEEEKRKEEAKKQAFGGMPHPIAAMRFDLKNVKLKIPKVPHTLFGRLMAKDDYFPTSIGVFDCEVRRDYLQDRRQTALERRAKEKAKGVAPKDDEETAGDGNRSTPLTLQLPVMSAWKIKTTETDAERGGTVEKEDFVQMGLLTIRILGYLQDPEGDDGDGDRAE